MKAKTLVELLTLSTNIYMITKDEKFMNNLQEMTQKGKEKIMEFSEKHCEGKCGAKCESGKHDSEESLMEKLVEKATQAKHEFENKMEEVAKKMYEKMNLAHTDYIKDLESQVDQLKKELSLSEQRIVKLETKSA